MDKIKKYGIHIVVVLFSSFAILLEGLDKLLLSNNLYRLILTVGLFYICAVIYRSIVGKIIAYVLLFLLTINFSLSLISRMVYNSSFDETQATSILLTNSSEGIGMLGGYITYILISILYFGISILLTRLLASRKSKEKMGKRYAIFLIANIILYGGISVDSFLSIKRGHDKTSRTAKFLYKIPLFNASRFCSAFDLMNETSKILKTKVDYSDIKIEKNNIENIVVIIGESARKDAFSLYGNPIKTSPNIDNRKSNLMLYENAVAPAPYTILAVPMMLSKAIPSDEYSALEVSDNVVNIANYTKQWNTYWVSSQKEIGIHENAISAISYFCNIQEWSTEKYDEYLIPMIKNIVDNITEKKLIIVHTLGSHYPLTDRYPKEFDIFKENKKQHVNEYYNSVYYTDYVIEQIIKEIEKTPSILIYASDHGQIDNKTMFTHSLAKKGLDVPFFVWHSDLVEEKYKITTNINTPTSTTELYEVIKYYMGVTNHKKPNNEELKVLSGDMKVHYYGDLKDE